MSDDRITCAKDCALHMKRGVCGAAAAGEMPGVSSKYTPTDIPRRCSWFKPKEDASDQRTAQERWPNFCKWERTYATPIGNRDAARRRDKVGPATGGGVGVAAGGGVQGAPGAGEEASGVPDLW